MMKGNEQLREGTGLLTEHDLKVKKMLSERQKLRDTNTKGRGPKFLCPKCTEPVNRLFVRNGEGYYKALPAEVFYCPKCDGLIKYRPEMLTI